MIEGYHCTLMRVPYDRGLSLYANESIMYDRGISIASLYANESVMCDRGRSVASLYTNEKYLGSDVHWYRE